VNQANKWLLGSLAGSALVASVAMWEGTEYTPYRDVVGVLTVCNGYTGPDIVPGKTYGKAECDLLLKKELTEHGLGVLKCTQVPLNQNQYDAFASFAYNVGVGAYCKSTLVKKLNAGDYTGACNELLRWNKAGGKVYRGLTRRREAERALCLKPMEKPRVAVAQS
jgi:lysozyme